MNFLIDAQLPARLRSAAGRGRSRCDSHLGAAGREPDDRRQDRSRADAEDRVVVTKDRDFRDSHLLEATPRACSS
ncbi:MAG: DUF5615 family PIN-like protein [Acidimicrobiales bacterium]